MADNFRTRLMKNALESFAGQLGTLLGRSDLTAGLTQTLGAQLNPRAIRGLATGGGILGSTLLQAPNLAGTPVITSLFRQFGISADAAQRIVNEMVDEGVQEFAEAIRNGTDVPDTQMRSYMDARARELIKKLKDPAKELTGDYSNEPVFLQRASYGNPKRTTYLVHAASCPSCQPQHMLTKDGGTALRNPPGIVESTIGQALQSHFGVTTEDCCKHVIQDLFKKARKKPMDLFELINSFPTVFPNQIERVRLDQERFALIICHATESQTERIQAAGTKKIWADRQEYVRNALQQSLTPAATMDVEVFLKFIEAVAPRDPQSLLQVAQGMVSGGRNETVTAVRNMASKVASEAEQTARVARLQAAHIRRIRKGW